MNHLRLVIVAALLPLVLVVGCGSRGSTPTFLPSSSAPSSVQALGPVPVPAKFVGGYLESWTSLLPRNLPPMYSVLFSAFATIDVNGVVAYQPNQDDPALVNTALVVDIAAQRAARHPVILSIGGSGGSKSGLDTVSEQQAFLSSIMPIIDKYGFSGIDWDVEAGAAISVPGLAVLSHALVDHYGPTFAITLAPYGPTTVILKQLARQIRDIVTFVGYQFYNNDNTPTPDSVVAEMDSWIAESSISPSQFSLGFMPQDDDGKVTSYNTMVSIYNAVQSKYPTVRGVWVWAVDTDQSSGWQFVNILAPVVRG